MSKTIIGIVGVKESGKSTAGEIIRRNISGRDILETALADKLKNVCSEVFNIPRPSFDDQRYKEVPFSIFNLEKELTRDKIEEIIRLFNRNPSDFNSLIEELKNTKLNSPRHIAQIVGTQLLRALDDEYIHCKNLQLGEDITLITDIRFPNEHYYFNNLKGYDFTSIYISRDVAEDKIDFETSHSSETSVFLFRESCYRIDNNGTLEELEDKIKAFINGLN